MYKPISNYNNSENPAKKSLLCNQVESGEILADQLLCCPNDAYGNDGKCVSYTSDCLTDNKRIARCHNLTSFDACRRDDKLAVRVCGWKDGLFCISTRAPTNAPNYKLFPEALKWIANRSKLEESQNITNPDSPVTVCDYGQGYQLCDSTDNSVAYLKCGDLFQSKYDCNWTNNIDFAGLPRFPLGEVCEIKPITTSNYNDLERNLTIGIGFPGCLIFGALAVLLIWKKPWKTTVPPHNPGGNPQNNGN
jgi:hypothetical protein